MDQHEELFLNQPQGRPLVQISCFLGLIALMFLLGCSTNRAVAGPQPIDSVHEFEITARAGGWDAPGEIPAGWTKVTLINESDFFRQAAFYRLDDGMGMEDVYAAIDAGLTGAPAWWTPHGGASGVMPGDSTTVVIDLPAGQYIVIDPVPEADGIPGMAKGFFMPLAVKESSSKTAAPAADLEVELQDYTFNIDFNTISSGAHTLKVTNASHHEPHEVVIVRLDPGKTAHDYLAGFEPGATEPPPGYIVAGTAPVDNSTINFLEVEFESGENYAFICFLPSVVHEGAPHFSLGMIGEFSVP